MGVWNWLFITQFLLHKGRYSSLAKASSSGYLPLCYKNMYKEKNIWLLWRKEKLQNGNSTKIPYCPNGKKASTTNPNSWFSYQEVKGALARGDFTGIGVVLEPKTGLVGVDFDHCVKDKKITLPEVQTFIENAQTYCEYSPSNTGLHLIFHSTEPVELERNKHSFNEHSSVEVYANGRYFTFTENEHPLSKEVRKISQADFIALLQSIGYPWRKQLFQSSHTVITDKEVLRKMFSSKNGERVKRLWNGDISLYNNDDSSADFALCMHFAFWTGKNAEQMLSLWLASPLGNREKTQKRKDYQDRTIQNAIEYTTECYTPQREYEAQMDDYIQGKDSRPLLILENVARILETDTLLVGKFRLNDFSHLTETNWEGKGWMNLHDAVILELVRYLSSRYEWARKLSKEMATQAILSVAYRHRVNPVKEFLTSLVWDGVPRLNSWLHHTYGVSDDELNQAIGANWLKGLVKRVMRPGCVFDEVLALESPQGWRKSTSVRELGTPWHAETTYDIDNKDFYLLLAQNIIVEFSEGEIFDRSSVKKIKAEITKVEDQIRPPYERGMLKFPRSCVFAVTTNKLELKDDTGNRRWLPVSLNKPADISWLRANRNQLFAEAFRRVIVLGETTHEYPKEALEDLQQSRGEWSDYDEKAMKWYGGLSASKKEEGIALHDCINALFGTSVKITRLEELQTASILRRTLFLESKNKKVDGTVLRRWVPTKKTPQIKEEIW
jgi:predicted P-loop ATPase